MLLLDHVLTCPGLSLSGCLSTSPILPDLYIVSISRNTTSFPEVRLGYFGEFPSVPVPYMPPLTEAGMCTTSNGTATRCFSTARSSAVTILPALFPDVHNTTEPRAVTGPSSNEITSLLVAALIFQSQVFIPILAGGGVLFLVGLILLVVLKRSVANPNPDKPKRVEMLKVVLLGFLWLSTALSFTACLSTSETTGALQYSFLLSGASGSAAMIVKPGMALQVLQWLAFGMTMLFTISVPLLLRGGQGSGGEKV